MISWNGNVRQEQIPDETIKFSFQDCHYLDVFEGQSFAIMEGARQAGEGKIISIEK